MTTLLIDCDAPPKPEKDWEVFSHTKGGQLEFDPALLKLKVLENQFNGTEHVVLGLEPGERVLNANVLDALLAHPEYIPDELKGKFVFFIGTIYRSKISNAFRRQQYDDDRRNTGVRYLRWIGDIGWVASVCGFGPGVMDPQHPAAVL
jgi:hypothetical protein